MERKKMLIVDDEKELVEALKVRFEVNGYQVEVGYDGPSAIIKAKEAKPDLVLLDIVMPGMDGLDVCDKLKDDPETKDILIIVFTALQRPDLKERCEKCRADGFIEKPFESEELMALVDKLLKS